MRSIALKELLATQRACAACNSLWLPCALSKPTPPGTSAGRSDDHMLQGEAVTVWDRAGTQSNEDEGEEEHQRFDHDGEVDPSGGVHLRPPSLTAWRSR